MSAAKRVFNLYGMDQNGIPVSMFFANESDLAEFVTACPGTYDTMRLDGIGYDDFDISHEPKPDNRDWLMGYNPDGSYRFHR